MKAEFPMGCRTVSRQDHSRVIAPHGSAKNRARKTPPVMTGLPVRLVLSCEGRPMRSSSTNSNQETVMDTLLVIARAIYDVFTGLSTGGFYTGV